VKIDGRVIFKVRARKRGSLRQASLEASVKGGKHYGLTSDSYAIEGEQEREKDEEELRVTNTISQNVLTFAGLEVLTTVGTNMTEDR
jgi:hypothetical protein